MRVIRGSNTTGATSGAGKEALIFPEQLNSLRILVRLVLLYARICSSRINELFSHYYVQFIKTQKPNKKHVAYSIKIYSLSKRITSHSTSQRVRVKGFKVTFNNISIISWQSVYLVEETGITG
jgi:hypothetical protein